MSVRKRAAVLFICFILVSVASGLFAPPAVADDPCEVCESCSADPVFVQRDQRRSDLVRLLRRVGAKGRRSTRDHLIVLDYEGDAAKR